MIDSTQTEKSVIQAFIVDCDAPTYISSLTEEDFTNPNCRDIFKTIAELDKQQQPIDLNTLSENHDIGMLVNLTKDVTHTINTKQNVKRLIDRRARRDILMANAVLSDKLKDPKTKTSDALGDFYADIRNNSLNDEMVSSKKVASNVVKLLEQKKLGLVKPLDIGYKKLGDLIKFSGGKLIVLAARPSVGKTILCTNIAWNVSKTGKNVLYFSLEMSPEEINERILAYLARVDSARIQDGRSLNNIELEKISTHIKTIANASIDYAENLEVNIGTIESTIRSTCAQKDISLVVIDYLQLIGRSKFGNTNDQISEITRRLKLTAKSCKVDILLLSQLNRTSEREKRGRPMLSDLRDSGAIEQDADSVIFIDRPYMRRESPDPAETYIYMGKNRANRMEDIKAIFSGEYQYIEEEEEVENEQNVRIYQD
jgi:replicative DNA helicase